MAYRRSIIARAKLLYQEERFAPSFTHINHHNNDDDRRSNRSSMAEGPKVPNFLQNRYFTSGGVNRFGGSRGLFQDPRFSFTSQPFMGSMNYGLGFSRNMSSTVGEGAVDKIEYISDMADVLADTSVEAVTAAAQVAAPAVNEVAVAAADSFFPVAALQYLIEYVHTFTGLNWWASIALTTLLIRWLTVPLLVNQLKATSKFTLLRPRLEEIKEEMQNRVREPNRSSNLWKS